ncbi:hypothetical protein ACQEU6_13330 [Spirillospora sp. CA-108201]
MADCTEQRTALPVDLVEVAVAGFEEVWRSRDYSLTLLSVLSATARQEAEFRLRIAPRRDATDALTLAWGVVFPILVRLLQDQGFFAATIDSLIAESAEKVTQVTKSDGGL